MSMGPCSPKTLLNSHSPLFEKGCIQGSDGRGLGIYKCDYPNEFAEVLTEQRYALRFADSSPGGVVSPRKNAIAS